jgi:hypothetical protein
MKRPSFQFYPADWLSDMQVRLLPWASRGLYMDLICYCWREGWIPSDGSAIAQLCGCHDLAIIEPCLLLFQPHPEDPSKLVHKRLIEEKNQQDNHRKERSESGKRGAKARWNKDCKLSHSSANGSAIKQPIAKNASSTSTSTSTFFLEEEGADRETRTSKAKGTLDQLRTYAKEIGLPESDGESRFYGWEANGWMTGKNRIKDWKAAMRTWKANRWLPSQQTAKIHDAPAPPPSFEEVAAYAEENNQPYAESFYDYAATNGWRTKTGPIIDWKAAFRQHCQFKEERLTAR